MVWANGPAVRRVLSRRSRGGDGHLSRTDVAVGLQRSTRGLGEQPQRPLSDLAPGEVYRADPVTRTPGGLLHHRFTLTDVAAGGLLSVALSRGLLRVGVTHRPALWSPDVPRHSRRSDATVSPTHSHGQPSACGPRSDPPRSHGVPPGRPSSGTSRDPGDAHVACRATSAPGHAGPAARGRCACGPRPDPPRSHGVPPGRPFCGSSRDQGDADAACRATSPAGDVAGRRRTPRGQVPQALCAARVAAPMMPALLRSVAGMMSACRSRSGRYSSCCFETPPPTTKSSGESRASSVE